MSDALYAPRSLATQTSLPGCCPAEDALKQLSQANAEARGAVFTRREVVEFILDLVGYAVEQPLYNQSLLEPSFATATSCLSLLSGFSNRGGAVETLFQH